MAGDAGDESRQTEIKGCEGGGLREAPKPLSDATQEELEELRGIGTKASALIFDAYRSGKLFETWEQV
jgi:hypothetical protein